MDERGSWLEQLRSTDDWSPLMPHPSVWSRTRWAFFVVSVVAWTVLAASTLWWAADDTGWGRLVLYLCGAFDLLIAIAHIAFVALALTGRHES